MANRVDVARPEDVERLADETYHAFGAAHVVCSNAGVAVIGAVHEHTLEDKSSRASGRDASTSCPLSPR